MIGFSKILSFLNEHQHTQGVLIIKPDLLASSRLMTTLTRPLRIKPLISRANLCNEDHTWQQYISLVPIAAAWLKKGAVKAPS
jgi:hypothetical protein